MPIQRGNIYFVNLNPGQGRVIQFSLFPWVVWVVWSLPPGVGEGRDRGKRPCVLAAQRCTPTPAPFWGRFSLREVMMLRVFASILPQPLLPRHTSSSPRHLPARQEQARLLRLWDGRPGFGHQAAHGPRRLVEQRDQEADPAPAKDTHEPQACGTPRPRRPRGQGGDVRYRAGGKRLLRLAPDAQQPQGGPGDGQPQARGPVWPRPVGALPLPARALSDLEAPHNPRPPSRPTGGTGFRRQIGQDQPRILVARLPARQEGPVELAVAACAGDAR